MLSDSSLKSLRGVSWHRGVRRLRRAANAFPGASVSAYAATILACPCCNDVIKAQHSVRFLAAKKYEKNSKCGSVANYLFLWQKEYRNKRFLILTKKSNSITKYFQWRLTDHDVLRVQPCGVRSRSIPSNTFGNDTALWILCCLLISTGAQALCM